MAALIGFKVAETEKAIAFVAESDATKTGIKPLWVPRAKIESLTESDERSREIQTAQNGLRVGIPVTLNVDDAFLAKIVGA